MLQSRVNDVQVGTVQGGDSTAQPLQFGLDDAATVFVHLGNEIQPRGIRVELRVWSSALVVHGLVEPASAVDRVRVAERRADAVVPESEHHSLICVGQVVAVVHPDPGVRRFERHLPYLTRANIERVDP